MQRVAEARLVGNDPLAVEARRLARSTRQLHLTVRAVAAESARERDELRSLARDLAAALDAQLRGGGPTGKQAIALLARARSLKVAP